MRIALLIGVCISLLACSPPSDALRMGGADDSPPLERTLVADRGAKLRTTAPLNLRSGAGTSFDVLMVMPEGAIVTLRETEPENGFYAVSYEENEGWASGNYLTPVGEGESNNARPPRDWTNVSLPTATCHPNCLPVDWLANVLRDAGLEVLEDPGWQSRGHGSFKDLWGVMAHHTGDNGDNAWMVVRDGRSDLKGPLSQLVLEKNGTFRVVASGVAWHAGKGSYPGLSDNDANFHTLGIEAVSTGRESWSAAQYDAYVIGVAAILRYLALDSAHVIGHKEWAGVSQGKWDPGGIEMNDFRTDVQAVLAN